MQRQGQVALSDNNQISKRRTFRTLVEGPRVPMPMPKDDESDASVSPYAGASPSLYNY